MKFANVNGITIVSLWRVPDSTFVQACRIIDFMTRDLPKETLVQMVKMKSRMGIIARYEGTTDIPEHAHLGRIQR